MQETETVKKRTWVKDAAIVFLAVMLVLTFFSNTILNRSLPEAATVIIAPGSIDSKVRVSGTVNAKENYDVILEQSRKVVSVVVKVGQEVSTGDLLFTLESGDSNELDTAKDELHTLELQYQRKLIEASSADYSLENRSIAQARSALEKAQAKLTALPSVTDAAITEAKNQLSTATATVKELEKTAKAAETGVSNSSDGSGWSGGGASTALQNAVTEAAAALSQADNDRKAAHLAYDADYNALVATTKTAIENDYDAAHTAGAFAALTDAEKTAQYSALLPYYLQEAAKALGATDAGRVAYEKITAAEATYATARQQLTDAQAALADANNSGSYDGGTTYQGKTHAYWVKAYQEASEKLATAQEKQTDLQTKLDELKQQKTDYEAAQTEVTNQQNELEDQLFKLEQQKKTDGKQQQLDALDRQELQTQIANAKAKVEKLSGGDSATEVKSRVNGTVQSLAVSAGHTATAGDVLATIEVKDLGYTLNATVTSEQARLLHVGDTATVSNFYWGANTTAEITAIRPDPKNPQSGKLLMFDITGDVAAGSTLNFAIGEKNANYDLVVPNSAVRSDTNGSFLLIITAKNSPLGNRYYATRVDVEVLASDDLNSAVKGALEGSESVVTTTSNNAPLTNGDQVRLPDVN